MPCTPLTKARNHLHLLSETKACVHNHHKAGQHTAALKAALRMRGMLSHGPDDPFAFVAWSSVHTQGTATPPSELKSVEHS